MQLGTRVIFLLILSQLIIAPQIQEKDIKERIIITKQAIRTLKEKIQHYKQLHNLDFQFVEKSSNQTTKTSESHKIREIKANFQEDIKKDLDLTKKVYDYFTNSTHKEDEIYEIKNEIKENGIREIDELMDVMDNHPGSVLDGFNYKANGKDFENKGNQSVATPNEVKETNTRKQTSKRNASYPGYYNEQVNNQTTSKSADNHQHQQNPQDHGINVKISYENQTKNIPNSPRFFQKQKNLNRNGPIKIDELLNKFLN